MTPRVAVVGGGISGLAAAFELELRRRAGEPLDYLLLEASHRLGGVILTERHEDCLVEGGPDSFLTEKPWAYELCRDLGIADQVIGSNDARRRTYILTDGRLLTIPDGFQFMVPTRVLPTLLSPLFSLGTKMRMAAELFLRPGPGEGDETVAAMIERHYGREIVERLADPLLAGVYGGEAARLSGRAVLPRFVEMERQHGSLGLAILRARRRRRASTARGAPPPALFSSLRGGMQQLVETVVARLPGGRLRSGAGVLGVSSSSGRWSVHLANGRAEAFDGVVLALPATSAATLLESVSPEMARLLAAIPYTSSVTVSLGYERAATDRLPRGFGFLVPRREGRRLLACTFVHAKFPHRAPDRLGLLRVFLGGSRDAAALGLADADLLALVRTELAAIVGLTDEPVFARIHRWPAAMAQYESGHLDRLERLETLRRQLPGLALAGNAFRGPGVPDCIRTGRAAAAEIAEALKHGVIARPG